jgi:hypothetical protein
LKVAFRPVNGVPARGNDRDAPDALCRTPPSGGFAMEPDGRARDPAARTAANAAARKTTKLRRFIE